MKKEWKNPELLNCTLGATKETLCYCSEGEVLAASQSETFGWGQGGRPNQPGGKPNQGGWPNGGCGHPHKPGNPCPSTPKPNPNPNPTQS